MKTKNLRFLLFLLLLSCGREEEYVMNDFIRAGEQNGTGIRYTDLSPDIDCTIISPWDKTDTLINLDLDRDGQDDFILEGTMCHPQMLGADCETVNITPLAGAALCVDPLTGWLDTIPHLDTINIRNQWTSQEALIYNYYWEMSGYTLTEGCWHGITEAGRYYIGFSLTKNEQIHYGWIGMVRDTASWSFSFHLTDYALVK